MCWLLMVDHTVQGQPYAFCMHAIPEPSCFARKGYEAVCASLIRDCDTAIPHGGKGNDLAVAGREAAAADAE